MEINNKIEKPTVEKISVDSFKESKSNGEWREIPQELIRNPEATKVTIEILKFLYKVQINKTVNNTKGLNWFKYHFLGYVLLKTKA